LKKRERGSTRGKDSSEAKNGGSKKKCAGKLSGPFEGVDRAGLEKRKGGGEKGEVFFPASFEIKKGGKGGSIIILECSPQIREERTHFSSAVSGKTEVKPRGEGLNLRRRVSWITGTWKLQLKKGGNLWVGVGGAQRRKERGTEKKYYSRETVV